MSNNYQIPPIIENQEGEERRAGFEIEFTGVDMSQMAQAIAETYEGRMNQVSTYEYLIEDTRLGQFRLELDASLFLDKKYEPLLESLGISVSDLSKKDEFEDILKNLASTLVPYEIITPPVPITKLHKLNDLINSLRSWKAKGSESSFFYAFGLHINAEVPSLKVESLLSHLKAYILLDPWIREATDIEVSRKLTPFINEFKKDYIKHILDENYKPDLKTMVQDYIQYGNTRNRPLDMLPVFSYLKPEMVNNLTDDHLTSPRPTFHYRLPNCSIGDSNWRLHKEWNRWVLVEKLAADKDSLQKYAAEFLRIEEKSLFTFKKKWIDRINNWVFHARY